LAGGLDPVFGQSGRALVPINAGGGQEDVASDVAIDSAGRTVIVGTVDREGGNRDFAVTRLHPNGTIDTSFGDGWRKIIAFDLGGARVDEAAAVVIDSAGRIVVAGRAQRDELGDWDMAIARLTSTGALDGTFDGDGLATVAFNLGGGKLDAANDVVLDGAGRIVVAGVAEFNSAGDTDFAVARLTENGSLDVSFRNTGKRTIAFDLGGTNRDEATGVAIDGAGRIVLGGFSSLSLDGDHDFTVARLLADGANDTSLSGTGKLRVSFDLGGSDDDRATALAIDPVDGSIVLVGSAETVSGSLFAVVRLRATGPLDTSFDGDGQRTVKFSDLGGAGRDRADAVAIEPGSRRIIIAGRVPRSASGLEYVGVARMDASGINDASFGTNGRLVTSFASGDAERNEGAGVAIDTLGRIIVSGTVKPTSGGTVDFGATRLLGSESVLNFTAASTIAPESWPAVGVVLRRTGDLTATASVDWTIWGGGWGLPVAVLGTDYGVPRGRVTFAAGQELAMIVIPLLNDTAAEPIEGFTVVLSSPAGTSLGSAWNTYVAIVDDDPPQVVAVRPTRDRRGITAVIVELSEALEPADALQPAFFRVIRAGRDKRFGTRDDIVLKLMPQYAAGARTLVLQLARPLGTRENLMLKIMPSLRGANQAGMPGGSWVFPTV
jgi:uncharacterized delta-60 repeat protein